MQEKFESLRQQYPEFIYESYDIQQTQEEILLSFHFRIPGLCDFHPKTRIPLMDLPMINPADSALAKEIVFALGLVEAVSYWKCACPPRFVVQCRPLADEQVAWWKKLWFFGLGEFFYRNAIQTTYEDFVAVVAPQPEKRLSHTMQQGGCNLIPVGGGKDSCVTMERLRDMRDKNYLFTVNDQPARTECVQAAGYAQERIIRTYRSIDRELLQRNQEGYWNGHTPFSAIVAFLSYYCAYLIGAENIILSNESSADVGNVDGTQVNHQYSKSFQFEQDFTHYAQAYLSRDIHYFSLLRPFNELQIAKQFAAYPQYHGVFKSCNVGSKQNIWCGNCAKCLFVYCILSPFLSRDQLQDIFGENLLEKKSLLADLDGLCGFSPVKPFECVGTVEEVRAALNATWQQTVARGQKPEILLQHFQEKSTQQDEISALLEEYNASHGVPQEFAASWKGMYRHVSRID